MIVMSSINFFLCQRFVQSVHSLKLLNSRDSSIYSINISLIVQANAVLKKIFTYCHHLVIIQDLSTG